MTDLTPQLDWALKPRRSPGLHDIMQTEDGWRIFGWDGLWYAERHEMMVRSTRNGHRRWEAAAVQHEARRLALALAVVKKLT